MREKKIAELLSKKRAFFEVILELAQTEESLAFSEYVSTLEQKKILLSCIEEIDQRLDSFKESLLELSFEIHEQLESIRQIAEEILHLDRLNQNKRREELKRLYGNS